MKHRDLMEVYKAFEQINNKGIVFVSNKGVETFRSYRDIYYKANIISNHITGERVVFQIDNNELFVYTFWACIKKGILPIPLEAIKNKESSKRFNNICSILQPVTVICTNNTIGKFSENNTGLTLVNIEEIDWDATTEYENKCIYNDKVFVQFSSGSTGDPKGIILTHENLVENITAIQREIELVEDDVGLSWLPLTHDMGLIGFHLTPTCKFINHILIETKYFVFRPTCWLELISKYKATISSSPNFGYKFLISYINKKKIEGNYNLQSLRLIFNGAESIDREVVEEFQEHMEKYKLKKNVVFPVYGLAEGTLAIAFTEMLTNTESIAISRDNIEIGKRITPMDKGISIVSVGKEIQGVQVYIMKDNIPLDEGYIGKIYIKGKNVCRNIITNKGIIQAINKDGMLYTGDIGFKHNKELYIIGRETEIIINGKNYFCRDIEEFIESKFQNRIQIVSMPIKINEGEIVALFVKNKDKRLVYEEVQAIRREIMEETQISIGAIVFINNIPKTTSGKIKRFEILENYYKGDFQDIIWLNSKWINESGSPVEVKILEVFKNIYGIDVEVNDDLRGLTSESVENMQFMILLEDVFNITFDYAKFAKMASISEMALYISNVQKINSLLKISS